MSVRPAKTQISLLSNSKKMANYKQAYSYLYHLDVCLSRVQGKDTSFNSASNKAELETDYKSYSTLINLNIPICFT